MNLHALLKWKEGSWFGGTASTAAPTDPGTKHFNASELALLKHQRKAGNEVARDEVAKRGVTVNPRIAAARKAGMSV